MAKITALPPIDPETIDGSELVPAVKDGETGLASLVQLADGAVSAAKAGVHVVPEDVRFSISTANGAVGYRLVASGEAAGLLIPVDQTGQNSFWLSDFPAVSGLVGGETVFISVEIDVSAAWTRTWEAGVFRRKAASSPLAAATVVSNTRVGNKIALVLTLAAEADDLNYALYFQLTGAVATATDESTVFSRARLRVENTDALIDRDADLNLDASIKLAARNLALLTVVGKARREARVVLGSANPNEFASINDAIAFAGARADITEPWDVVVTPGTYNEHVILRDDVNLIGLTSGARPKIAFHQPADIDLSLVTAYSAIEAYGRFGLFNLEISVQNGRYALHADDPSLTDKLLRVRYCQFEHLGNQEVIDYRGSADGVWASVCALGMGTYGGFRFEADGCLFRSPVKPLFFHTAAGAQYRESEVRIRSSRIIAPTADDFAFQAQSIGSGQRCVCDLTGNSFTGMANYLRSGADDEIVFTGFGNEGLVFETTGIDSGVEPVSYINP